MRDQKILGGSRNRGAPRKAGLDRLRRNTYWREKFRKVDVINSLLCRANMPDALAAIQSTYPSIVCKSTVKEEASRYLTRPAELDPGLM